ncbi:universal stress protein [Nocardia sp. SYP-A9097]|uniref:universal stress protein n=1 Tax=Nocardia sp. SYP-A9097 TaxID=2663237 RepID=UPI00129B59D1|nr:universal stress protein [Nocardia sp. SYP-A9097]MRH87606.1 universal stress protein [Nocardia sp. SYP-A9097]
MTENAVPATDSVNQPIVAAADGSEISYQAVAWAAVEAELLRCPLHIITSFGIVHELESRSALSAAEKSALRSEGERVLAEALEVARHAAPSGTLAVTTELTFELITPTLLDRSRQARMLVVGNRGRGAIRRALLGSVSTALSRHAHCPVAVVHGVAKTGADTDGKPIVVGVDGTANSLPAIELAFQEASRRKAPLIAVRAWSDSSGFDLPVVGWDVIRETEEVLLSRSLESFAERYPDVRFERYIACDTPVRALLEHAEGAQLLVVGSHGRSGFSGMVIGSVSTALLHTASCPVLVVRQP